MVYITFSIILRLEIYVVDDVLELFALINLKLMVELDMMWQIKSIEQFWCRGLFNVVI